MQVAFSVNGMFTFSLKFFCLKLNKDRKKEKANRKKLVEWTFLAISHLFLPLHWVWPEDMEKTVKKTEGNLREVGTFLLFPDFSSLLLALGCFTALSGLQCSVYFYSTCLRHSFF